LPPKTRAPAALTPISISIQPASQPIDPQALIHVLPTTSHVTVPFTISITGSGSAGSRIGAFDLNKDTGIITIDAQSVPALVYYTQPFGDTLYQTIAVTDNAWFILWFYCSGANTIDTLYYESTDGDAVTDEDATGTCFENPDAWPATAAFPASTIDSIALVPGFTVQGKSISYDGAHPGTTMVGANRYAWYPFNFVDCSECGSDGWYELHSLLIPQDRKSAAFGIFYLQNAGDVDLYYGIDLPYLTNPAGATGAVSFAAQWTVPSAH
jgi:hypothetical protein